MEKVAATREERAVMRKLSEDVAKVFKCNYEVSIKTYESSRVLNMQLNVLAHVMAHAFIDLYGDTGKLLVFMDAFLRSFHEETKRFGKE